MNKYIFLSLILFLISFGKGISQHLVITQQDSLEILEKAGLKIMFFEATLNYLADPYSKAKSVLARKSYEPSFQGRVFWNENILLDQDLNPLVIKKGSTDERMTVPEYLNVFQQVYQTDDPKSVVIRVSKIKSLLRKGSEVFVEAFFDRTMGGVYSPDDQLLYTKSYHLARVKVIQNEGDWQCYLTSIRLATEADKEYYIPEDYKQHVQQMPHLREKGL